MVPLAAPTELAPFADGTMFAVEVVAAASAHVRGHCGWHIAPQITETVTVDVAAGGGVLFLPTLHLVAVGSVTGVSGDVLDGWRMSTSGMLSRRAGWPSGFGAVEVEITHGYAVTPAELFPVIVERCRSVGRDGMVRQESLGSRSVSYGADPLSPAADVLARYVLPALP